MEFTVEGMTCGHCARAVTDAVRKIDPQASVEIDLAGKRVSVQSNADATFVEAAIAEAGYDARHLAA